MRPRPPTIQACARVLVSVALVATSGCDTEAPAPREAPTKTERAPTKAVTAPEGNTAPAPAPTTAPTTAPPDPTKSAPTEAAPPDTPPPTKPAPPDDPPPEGANRYAPVFAGLDLGAGREQVVDQIATRWCERGGVQFTPPPRKDDDDFRALESCAAVSRDVVKAHVVGRFATTLLHYDADQHETIDVLLYQAGPRSHAVVLDLSLGDESGEAGASSVEYDTIELRDVMGDPAPEWIATVTVNQGGSFEADRCYNHDHTRRDLVICQNRLSRLACLRAPFANYTETKPWPKDELDECDEDVDPNKKVRRLGYAMSVKVTRDAVTFTPAKRPVMARPTEDDYVEEPPHRGRVELAALMQESPLVIDE